jgi:hypothetical protein
MAITSGSRSALQFQPAFYAVQPLIRPIGGKLLQRVGGDQMSQMLDHGGDATFQIADAADQFIELSLNAILGALEALQVFKDQINGRIAHGGSISQSVDPE